MSLQDQLLKAGLVNEKKLKKAKKSSKKSRTLKKEVKAAVDDSRSAQMEKSAQANKVIQQEQAVKELAAQVKQLILMNEVALAQGEVEYRFTVDNKVKVIVVDSKQQKQLANGVLAIAELDGVYKLIPAGAAEKIKQRMPEVIALINVKEAEIAEEDDPYADFQIPDDLMW
ncbi:DUF2058 domain-containing protein [Saccharobesus litoralis]|nr:DUF2058 domain-containing protein [Saccharobesus litoralis]